MTEHTPVIVGAVRTPTGKFLGNLVGFTAPQLGAIAIREAVRRAGIAPEAIDEVIMGNVVTAGIGQAPARQAAIGAGLSVGKSGNIDGEAGGGRGLARGG